jgi:hypothetical protein
LEEPIEGDFGPLEGIFLPESSLSDRYQVEKWDLIGFYVYTYESEEEDLKAIDIQVLVGEGDDGRWYVKITDEIDGDELWEESFDTFEEAKEEAEDHISASNESEVLGETAVAYIERLNKRVD